MKKECTIVFKSQSGQRLNLSDRSCTPGMHDRSQMHEPGTSFLEFHKQGCSGANERAATTEYQPDLVRSRLGPVIGFFADMPSFEQVTIIVTSTGDSKHVITMSSQAAVVRLLPYLFEGYGENLVRMPRINFSLDTHPFLKTGWIQQELHFIITRELLNYSGAEPLERVLTAVEANFQKKLEVLYCLHNHVVSLESQCSPLCNGLATAIMCVEYILLNPREVLERMFTDETQQETDEGECSE